MQRDRHQDAGWKASRQQTRSEWAETAGERRGDFEGSGRARVGLRSQRTSVVREREAERQIRELRSRY